MKSVFYLTILMVLLVHERGRGQDIHLSHIHASPTFLNPAMTALINEDIRLIANYRSQWQSFTKGYQTFVASADGKAYHGLGRGDEFGVGIQLMADQAGDLKYQSFDGAISLSYLKALNREGDHIISLGMRHGIIQNKIDLADLKLFEQDPGIFNENFDNNIINYDLSGGAAWFVPFGRGESFHLGVSMFHINRAFYSFTGDKNYQEGQFLQPRYVFHFGGSYNLGWFTTLKPSVILMNQGPHREINGGTFLKITKEARTYLRPLYSLYAGAWLRWTYNDGRFQSDAVVGSVRYDYRNTVYTFSFDINISNLARASSGFGGPELSIIKYFEFDRPTRQRSRLKCPAF